MLILVTFLVSKEDKTKLFKLLQQENISLISVTLLVSKEDKSKLFKL